MLSYMTVNFKGIWKLTLHPPIPHTHKIQTNHCQKVEDMETGYKIAVHEEEEHKQ